MYETGDTVGTEGAIIMTGLAIIITRGITTEDITTTIVIVEITMTIVVVAVDIILVISMEIFRIIKSVMVTSVRDIRMDRVILNCQNKQLGVGSVTILLGPTQTRYCYLWYLHP